MRQIYDLITNNLNTLKDEERDVFIDKILPIMPERTKNEIWENNHAQVTWALASLIQEKGRMPTKTEVAIKTGLSRQTIHKHIKEYASNPLYSEQIEQFKFLSSKVLARVYSLP